MALLAWAREILNHPKAGEAAEPLNTSTAAAQEAVMDFAISMDWTAVIVLVIGSLGIGVLAQMYGTPAGTWEFLGTAIGAFVGAVIASEFIVGQRIGEPFWGGVSWMPALAGGIVLGVITSAVMRWLARGTPIARGPGHV
jgi:hypothetical protein